MKTMTFRFWKKGKRWSWRLSSPNGRIVADGGGHNTLRAAQKSVESMLRSCSLNGFVYVYGAPKPKRKRKAK